MSDTNIKIILDKDYYENDEFITGKISLKSRIPLSVKKINLNLTKSRTMEICKIKSSEPEPLKYSKNTKEYFFDFEIYSSTQESSELSSGAHIFPFKFCLKDTDSSTTEIKGIYFDYLVNIINSYVLTASLYTEVVYEAKKELQIVEIIDKTAHFQTNIELSTIFCLLYKTYTVKFILNKPLYFSGDQLALTIQVNNTLRKIIQRVECNLYEVMSIQSPDIDVIRTRFVVGGNAILEKKNYSLNLRIPSSTPTSVNEDTFGLKILMFVNIIFKNSGPVRIKKYLQVIKRNNQLPEIENLNVLEGDVFDEKIFVLT